MNKVKLPREVAEAIQVLRKWEFTNYGIIIDSEDPSNCPFKVEKITKSLSVIRDFTFRNTGDEDEGETGADILLNALVNGYEIKGVQKV